MARMLVIAMVVTASVGTDRAAAQDKGQRPVNRVVNVGVHFGIGPGILLNVTTRQQEAWPASKIAVVNIGKVFINYEKARA